MNNTHIIITQRYDDGDDRTVSLSSSSITWMDIIADCVGVLKAIGFCIDLSDEEIVAVLEDAKDAKAEKHGSDYDGI